MNKKILGLIAILIVTVVAVINVNVDLRKSGMSDLSLANVEALAGFEFNGQYWDDEHHWYNLGNNWKPELHPCTGTSGGANLQIGIPNVISYSAGGETASWTGKMVKCVSGSGNCFNGTNCIPD